MALRFQVTAEHGAARCGRLTTPHGDIETPAFMPVGTLGAVKGIPPWELARAGAQVMLANLYHLALRPGVDAVESLGGLHAFCGWKGPLVTDSGGYQVFSLGDLRRVDDGGVTFRSHLDGAELRFTPRGVVADQVRLGVDLAMVLDECPPWPVAEAAAEASLERTLAWARSAREAWPGGPGGLFGIVQGSTFRRLRERGVRELEALDFDGYAIGGVSVGEGPAERREAVEWTAPLLPRDRPRYLMGVGTPADLAHAVTQGVDLFDCVLPARNGRHGVLFTRSGPLRIKNARFRTDPRPPEEGCRCPVCAGLSRAFLHHLVRAREVTGGILATLHNLHHYLDLMRDLRHAILSGTLGELAAEVAGRSRSELPLGEPRSVTPERARGSSPS